MDSLEKLVNELLARVEKLEAELKEVKSRLPHDSGRMGA
jgi:hypothetical protein